MTAAGIFWLTRDFRFSDNPALCAALAEGPLLPVFLIDRQLRAQGAASRWRLERALRAFDEDLRRRSGRGVVVLEGEPEQVFPKLIAATGARRIHQGDWPLPEMRGMQDRVRQALHPLGAELILHGGHLLVHPGMVRTAQGGVYRVYTPFARAVRSLGPDRPGPAAPDRIVAFADAPTGSDPASLDLAPDMRRGRPVLDRFALPAGENAAIERLHDFLDRVEDYARDRDRPDIEATSGVSEHLAVGEISARSIWAIAQERSRRDPRTTEGIGKFLSELIWREFAWHLLIDFPQLAEAPWRAEWADFPWRGENADYTRWCRAQTGIGLVDAGLREMRVTGRMHNRVRMVVASWLTKQLLTDWRLGLRHFEDSLTDWDPASNAMNWQWVAGCGPDASPFFRIFNPQKQAVQYDPYARYRRRWLAGSEGEAAPEALAYFDTLPPGWERHPAPQDPAPLLEGGRERALQSYQDFRARLRD